MIISPSLLNEFFRGFTIQRWNDKIRPVELIEMDKHAHKMIIAYALGKYEEMDGKIVNWENIIKGGIFELLRRIVISDIKSPIFYKIKSEHKEVFKKLNNWVYSQLERSIENDSIKYELKNFLNNENYLDSYSNTILDAAHRYASFWEFQIIKQANPQGYQIKEIERELLADIDKYQFELTGLRKLMAKQKIADFIDLCGQLRFQIRWSQIPRVPRTSVLGHTMLVACIAYFFARENDACPKRIFNDFFGGLFHDLPEAVTRDIISPVKRSSPEFEQIIHLIEEELAEKEIYPLIEEQWISDLNYFTRDEFDNKIKYEGIIQTGLDINEINNNFNKDDYDPIDGKLIRAADHLAAFLEAWYSSKFGIKSEEFNEAMIKIKDDYKNSVLGKVALKNLYNGFQTAF